MKRQYPKKLYVLEPLDEKETWEGYTDVNDLEDDDSVAIYILQDVCRVKVSKVAALVKEKDLNIAVESLPNYKGGKK